MRDRVMLIQSNASMNLIVFFLRLNKLMDVIKAILVTQGVDLRLSFIEVFIGVQVIGFTVFLKTWHKIPRADGL